MPAQLKAKVPKGGFRVTVPGIIPYDLTNILDLLATPDMRKSMQKERERRAALTGEERHAEDVANNRAWRKIDKANRLREITIRRAIEAVVSGEDWDWFENRLHAHCDY